MARRQHRGDRDRAFVDLARPCPVVTKSDWLFLVAWLGLTFVIAFGLWSPGLSLVLRRLTRAFSFYMGIAFIGRPSYLLLAQPTRGSSTGLADPLLSTPTYWQGIQTVSRLALLGLLVFLLCVYLIGFITRHGWYPVALRRFADLTPYWLIWVACWLCRIAIQSALLPPSSPLGLVAERLLPVATALLGVIILTVDWRSVAGGRRAVLVIALGEVLWSYLDASKTPLLASLLFFYVDPGRGRLSLRLFGASLVGLATAFLLIQSVKPGQAGHAYVGLPIWQRLTASVLTRLDAVHAVAVAHMAGPGSYLSYGTVATRILTGWIPQQLLGINRLGAGEMWAQVMNHSLPGVSLAQGPVAEGYAVAGLAGVVLWSALSAVALVGAAWVMASVRSFSSEPLRRLCDCVRCHSSSRARSALSDVIGGAIQSCLICGVLVGLG